MDSLNEILAELAALKSTLGDTGSINQIFPPHLESAIELVANGECVLEREVTQNTLSFTLTCKGRDDFCQGSSSWAECNLEMDLSYPNTAVRCTSIAAGGLLCHQAHIRAWGDAVAHSLNIVAEQASIEARPCLFELVELLQGRVMERIELGCQSTVEATCSTSGAKDVQLSTSLILLKIDHMHNQSMYTRFISGAANSLGLTGRLVFYGSIDPPLILLLLEGDPKSIKEYLVRHRTSTVDVDSRGRKCRERMMGVIAEVLQEARCFQDFAELCITDACELMSTLEAANLLEYFTEATGMKHMRGTPA